MLHFQLCLVIQSDLIWLIFCPNWPLTLKMTLTLIRGAFYNLYACVSVGFNPFLIISGNIHKTKKWHNEFAAEHTNSQVCFYQNSLPFILKMYVELVFFKKFSIIWCFSLTIWSKFKSSMPQIVEFVPFWPSDLDLLPLFSMTLIFPFL